MAEAGQRLGQHVPSPGAGGWAPSLGAVLTEPWWGHLVRQVTAVMGVGSVVFHATLRYAAQLFDELPLYAMARLAALTLPLPLPLSLTLTLTLTLPLPLTLTLTLTLGAVPPLHRPAAVEALLAGTRSCIQDEARLMTVTLALRVSYFIGVEGGAF